MPAAVWGLDIGQSSIKAVRLERAGSLAQLSNFDVIDIAPGEDENTRPARVRAALTELVNRRRLGQEPVLVALPGNQTFFRPFPLPKAPPGKLAGIVSFEARNQIPFPISEVLWDFKQIGPGDNPDEIRVGLIAIRRELVEQVLGLLRDFKLRLQAIQVAPLALYNLVRYEFGNTQSWLVLDAGARVTDFVVVDGEEFWFRPLPQSGNDLTRALEQKFRMSFEEAEALKLKMGESKQAQKIFQVIEPMLRNLVGDIQRTIGYYKGIRKEARIERVLAVGNAFRMPGMVKFLSQALDVTITPLGELGRLRIGPGVDVGWWREELPAMGVALGLGLQGLGLASTSMELLPEYILHERMLRRKRPLVAAGAVLALVASGVSLMAARRKLSIIEKDIKEVDKALEMPVKLGDIWTKQQPAVIELEERLDTWSDETARERGWVLECLDLLSRTKGVDGVEPVLGPKAAGGNGVYIRELYVSRDNPSTALAGRIDPTIADWYGKVSGGGSGGGRGRGAASKSRPMVVILQSEVAGPAYRANDSGEVEDEDEGKKTPADTEHAKRLERAIKFSSRVHLTAAGKKRLDTDEDVVTGFVGQSEEDREKGVVRFYSGPGAEPQTLTLKKHVERLAWLRNAVRGGAWVPTSRKIDTPERQQQERKLAFEEGRAPVFNWREYLNFTLAWVYDDGSTQLYVEEVAP